MRTLTRLSPSPDTTERQGSAGAPRAHESAVKHVTGRAAYIDDLPAPADTLHVALGLSPVPMAG